MRDSAGCDLRLIRWMVSERDDYEGFLKQFSPTAICGSRAGGLAMASKLLS